MLAEARARTPLLKHRRHVLNRAYHAVDQALGHRLDAGEALSLEIIAADVILAARLFHALEKFLAQIVHLGLQKRDLILGPGHSWGAHSLVFSAGDQDRLHAGVRVA